MEERLQKILAQAGYGSRRACEDLIRAGRVTVNDQIASLGSKADIQKDIIRLDGKPLPKTGPLTYVVVYKPRGVISAASNPEGRQTVRDLVPIEGRLYPVGRLDADSEGLILLTNDGELTNRLTHARYGHEKEYRVLVARIPDQEQLQAWKHGVVLEDGYHSRSAQVRIETIFGKGAWLRVILQEGRKRQIRETAHLLGLPVVRIIRIRIGSLLLGELKPGQWRHLKPDEIASLQKPEKQSPKRAEKPRSRS